MTPASVLRTITHPWTAFGANPLNSGPRVMPPQTGAPSTSGPASNAQTFAPTGSQPAGASASPFAAPTPADETSTPIYQAPPLSSSSGGAGAQITNAANSLASDQTTFLKLLTTQLKNQDPLSPMDTNAFTQQL